MQTVSSPFSSLLRWSGIGIWLVVSATTVARAQSPQRFLLWTVASAVFLIAFLVTQRAYRHVRPLLAIQSTAIVGMVASLCNGYEGFLLVLVAAQLGWREPLRTGFAWIGVQTAAIGVAIAYEWTVRSALLLTPPYLGFQVLMCAITRMLAEERAMRAHLDASHQKLLELQQQLAQKSRLDERLRMTQELHDVFGHRLTALSLNLETIAHAVTGAARSGIDSAQSLTRLLLDDVKALVQSYKDELPVDLLTELRALATELPAPRVHLDCPTELGLADARVGRALLRCAQEFVTNSIRHGAASNVWIRVVAEPTRVQLHAHDDGSGVSDFRDGFGLSGMKRRMQELGGNLSVEAPEAGRFAVRAELPLTPEAAA